MQSQFTCILSEFSQSICDINRWGRPQGIKIILPERERQKEKERARERFFMFYFTPLSFLFMCFGKATNDLSCQHLNLRGTDREGEGE